MGEQVNNPMYGEEFQTFKEEWNKAAGVLRPIVERQKELEPIKIDTIKPIRYGHAIRYEWREQTIWQ